MEILKSERGLGFWIVSLSMFLLTCISWINKSIVGRLNVHIFHAAVMANPGWWLYAGVRSLIALALGWMIFQFPKSSQGTAKAKPKRFEPLMGIRAMACLIVLLGHFFLIYFPFSSTSPLQMLLLSCPWAGVWLFFTLSGYLMGKGFVRGRYALNEAGYRHFMRNRILRIAPIYYVSIFVLSVYRYPDVFQWKHGWILVEMAIFDYRGSLPINPNEILWSVSTEMQFYLLAPVMILLLVYAKDKMGRGFVLLPFAFLCLGTVLRMWVKKHMGNQQMFTYGYAPLVPNFDLFIAGISINFFPKMQPKRWISPVLIGGCLGFYVLVSAITYYRAFFHMDFEDIQARGQIVCCIFAGFMIYLAESLGEFETHSLFLRGLQGIGTLTYCLYVFHPEVFAANARLPHSLHSSLERFPLVIIETFLMATLFYFSIEKPFDKKKQISHLSEAP